MKTKTLVAGAIVMCVGLLIVISVWMGFLPTQTLAARPLGTAGISVDTQPVTVPIMSSLRTGSSYEYKVTIRNTGSLTWPSVWAQTRICTSNSNPVMTTESGVDGNFYACSCPYGTDTEQCRENIESSSEWNMKYRTDGNWMDASDSSPGDQVFSGPTFTNVGPYQSKTFHLKIDVPSNKPEGTYWMLTNAQAGLEGNPIVNNAKDPLEVGTFSGTVTLEIIGIITAIIGGIIVVAALIV